MKKNRENQGNQNIFKVSPFSLPEAQENMCECFTIGLGQDYFQIDENVARGFNSVW